MPNYCLMRSEIARLVYGYLLETCCQESAQLFLEESPDLKEFAIGIKNGYPFSTKIHNQSLIEILNGQWSGPLFSYSQNSNSSNNNFNNGNNVNTQSNTMIKYPEITSFSCLPRIRNDDHVNIPRHKILQSKHHHGLGVGNANHCSPRRKNATPKKFLNNISNLSNNTSSSNHVPSFQAESNTMTNVGLKNYNDSQNISMQFSDHNVPVASSPLVNESSEIDAIVEPQVIFDELLKYSPLHNKLAHTIQKMINEKDDDHHNHHDLSNAESTINQQSTRNTKVTAEQISPSNNVPTPSSSNVCGENIGNTEKDLLLGDSFDEIINSLTNDVVFEDFVHMVVDKNIANTPYKLLNENVSTPDSFSGSSLHTPNILITPGENIRKCINQSDTDKSIPVKNLLKDLNASENKESDTGANVTFRDSSTPLIPDNKMDKVRTDSSTNLQNNNKISRPILQGFNAVPKFNLASSNQKELQEALNYYPTSSSQNQSVDTSIGQNSSKNDPILTTTIEEIPVNPSDQQKRSDVKTTTITTEQSSQMVQQQQQHQDVTNAPIELILPNGWTPSTSMSQSIMIPNNQSLSWNNNGVVYLTYPQQETSTIYFIDSSTASNNNNNNVQDNDLKILEPASSNSISSNQSQHLQQQSRQQERNNHEESSSSSVSTATTVAMESLKPSKNIPSILSKRVSTNNNNLNKNTEASTGNNNNDSTNNQIQSSSNSSNFHNFSLSSSSLSSNNKKDDINRNRKKTESFNRSDKAQINNNINNHKRRKTDLQSNDKFTSNKRNVSTSETDPSIQKLLGSNINEFLKNYHKDKN